MRYVAKDLGGAADISSGEGNKFLELIKLLVLALILILSLYFIAVYSSEYFISNISVEDENRWFGKMNLANLKDDDIDTDNEVAGKILAHLIKDPSIPKLNYRIFIIEDPQINAFAFPGGGIGISRGLIDEIDGEIPLAFIIGHELGHFKHRHHLKGFSRALSINFLFSIFLGDTKDLVLTQNMLSLLESNHSQQQESDSDLFAVKLVFDRYGTTENIEKLFVILNEKEKDKLSIPFLSTHPSSELRIQKLKRFVRTLNNDN